MARETVNARIRPDLKDWLTEYAEKRDISTSAAIEDCVRTKHQLEKENIHVRRVGEEVIVSSSGDVRGKVARSASTILGILLFAILTLQVWLILSLA